MKKLISLIISLSLFFSIVPVHAEDKISNINMPTSNCELGYIFSVSDNNFNGLNPDDYEGIAVISEELNIYYAQDLKSFKNVASKFDIAYYEENFIIETPDLPEEDFSQEISLFDDGDAGTLEPEPTIEPVSSEEPTETIAPDTTEMPVETETTKNTDEPLETIEPTQTDLPVENVDREETPTISIAYRSNSLSGFIANNIYTINGEEIIPNRTSISIDDSWYGTTISIVKKTTSDKLLDSEPQELYIPEIPDAPNNVSVRYKETYYGRVAIVSFDNPDKLYAGCRIAGEYRDTAGGSWKTQFTLNEDGTYEIYLADYSTTMSSFASKPAIVEVEGLYKVDSREPTIDSDDPFAEWQWYYEAVNANAYRENNITGKGVKVGIIDSGLNREHVDFSGVDIATGLNVCAYMSGNTESIYDITDKRGHGTQVASIIAAKSNNGIGITGLFDDCTIIPYKIENDLGYFDYSAALKAIELAYKDGCSVVNISAGGPVNKIYIEEITHYYAQKGLIVIASVGNDGKKNNAIYKPAGYVDVIGVGAVQPDCEMEEIWYKQDTREIVSFEEGDFGTQTWIAYTVKYLPSNSYVKSDFSSANESVFISAPGKTMMMFSSQNSDTYDTSSGTSFSSPVVTAAVAGIKQMRPYVDTDMVKEILKNTAIDLDEEGYDINTGYGMVDFEAIYNYVSEMPETIPEETPVIQIDYENNMLTGFDEDAEYSMNDVTVTPEDGSVAIDSSWYGNTISVVRKSRGDGYTDSEAQELSIPTVPDAPTTVSAGYNKITGVMTAMEYKLSSSDTWISCSDGEISNLEAGAYDVRLKASELSFASKIAQIQVENAPQAEDTPNIAIDYRNRVLTGFEGGSEYLVNESIAVISNGKLNIVEAWYGNSISIVKKSRGNGYSDSKPQNLNIPTIPKAPTTVSAGYNKITGVKTTMEYKLSSSDTWISCSGIEIVNLDAGTYDVRTKATTKSFASKSVQVEVLDLPIKPTTPPLEKEYTIETSVYYDETNNRVVFSTTNNTENTIYATGVVAVYDTNGILKYIKTIKTFPKGTLNQSFVYDDANCKIKFFIWKDLQSLQPYPDVKCSEWAGDNNG